MENGKDDKRRTKRLGLFPFIFIFQNHICRTRINHITSKFSTTVEARTCLFMQWTLNLNMIMWVRNRRRCRTNPLLFPITAHDYEWKEIETWQFTAKITPRQKERISAPKPVLLSSLFSFCTFRLWLDGNAREPEKVMCKSLWFSSIFFWVLSFIFNWGFFFFSFFVPCAGFNSWKL